MKANKFILFMMALLFGLVAKAQNTLSVPDIVGAAGKTITVPIQMTNQDEVVAVQFDVTLPFAKGNGDATLAAARNKNGHTVGIRSIGGNRYTVVIASLENKSLAGTSGTLVNIPMTVSSTAQYGDGKDYAIRLSNVVITNRRGDNIATGSSDGTFSVQRSPSPDLAVSDVACSASPATLDPGQQVHVSWRVSNHGEADTGAGWSEALYLVDVATGRTAILTNVHASERLAAGGSILREADVTIPATVGLDGEVQVRVLLTPNASTGELLVDRADNEAVSDATFQLSKRLYLAVGTDRLDEGSTTRLTVKRSGDTSMAETFSLSVSNASALRVPATVTFAPGQSAVAVDIQSVDNDDVNSDDEHTITLAAAHGYAAVETTLAIVDNDLLPMSVTLDKDVYDEGDTMHATIRVPRRIEGQPLTAFLSIEEPKRFKLPLSVVFPEGETEMTVDIPVVQDNKPANTASVELIVTADHYKTATALLQLNDDDVPAISFTMTPTTVSEGDGPAAMYCTLTRSEVTNNKITVKISDDSRGQISYGNGSTSGRTFTMEPGTTTINWYMGPVNNDIVDGDRRFEVTAAVYVTDCNCVAIGSLQSSVTHEVTIHDNDGPTLALTSAKTTLLEGNAAGTTVTVERNTSTAEALSVNLVCEDPDGHLGAETLVIPAGQRSASTTFSVSKNATSGDDRVIMLHAMAHGFTEGSTWIYVTDQTLPDYNINAVMPDADRVVAGDDVVLTLTVSNQGAADAPRASLFRIKEGSTTVYTGELPALAVDAQTTVRVPLTLPTLPGKYSYSLEVNHSNVFAELLRQNNTATFDITVLSAYNFSVTTDKPAYTEGETVHLSGTTRRGDVVQGGMAVEPYVVYGGERYALEATSLPDGTWTADFEVPEALRGDFVYGVCEPGAGSDDSKQTFTVHGMARATNGYIKHNKLYVGEDYVGRVAIANLSHVHDLTDIRAVNVRDDRDGIYDVTIASVDRIAAGEVAEVEYRIRPLQPSPTYEWDHIYFTLQSAEGATTDVTLNVHNAQREPNLVLSTTSINTTVSKYASRTYPITLTNTGLGETGRISIDMPKGLAKFVSLVTPSTLPSLATGDSTTVVLRFDGSDYDVNYIQKGSIAFNCEKGPYHMLYFNVKTVSDEMGSLRVRVGDESTYYGLKDGTHPYLEGARVSLKDRNSGATLYSDLTDGDGYVNIADVKEGYYTLFVTAERHSSYTTEVYINPGETTDRDIRISYDAVTIKWEVEETTVEDVYDIKTTVTYETQVPVPICLISMPDTIPIYRLEEGQTLMFNIVTRNVGLITATECNVSLPRVPGFTFTPLKPCEKFQLPAESSYIIPVLVTRDLDVPDDDPAANKVRRKDLLGSFLCNMAAGLGALWPCGGGGGAHSGFGGKSNDVAEAATSAPSCDDGGGFPDLFPLSEGHANNGGGGSGDNPSGHGSGSGGGGGAGYTENEACALASCLLPNLIPNSACPMAMNNAAEHKMSAVDAMGCALDVASNVPGAVGTAASVAGAALALANCPPPPDMSNRRKSKSDNYDLLVSYRDKYVLYLQRIKSFFDYYAEEVGISEEEYRRDSFYKNIIDVDEVIDELRNEGTLYDFDPATIRPNALTASQVEELYRDDPEGRQQALDYIGTPQWRMTRALPSGFYRRDNFDLRKYVERKQNIYRIADGLEPIGTNYPDPAVQQRIQEHTDSCFRELYARGFVDFDELVASARMDYLEYQEGMAKSVCASVRLELDQKLVIERQAFRGTLTIDNGSALELTDVALNLLVQRVSDGLNATSHEMQINYESLTGFNETLASHPNGGWSLSPGKKGVLTVLFIPTKYAAPTNLETFSFGGTLYFNDGVVDRAEGLAPNSLQVKPSPVLDLDYFMQRDVYGDNPLTPDVIEPVIPAEFTVLIHNKGYGEASKVSMLTQQPKIADNEKGLLADFEIVSSSLNGGEKSLALGESVATEFGSIAPGACTYATWDLTCSLLGHFTDYSVEATHVTSYGNPDLSLLDRVNIHELIHSVNADIAGKTYRAWIVNDYEDGHAEPDRIYIANGTDEELITLRDVTTLDDMGDGDPSTFRLTVDVPSRGWFYTSVINPSGGAAKIQRIYDETNGRELDPENFWTTAYVMQDGFDPLEEQRFHIVDLANGPQRTSYVVTFEPMPEVRLDIVSAVAVPVGLPDVEELVLEPATQFEVTFNKPIKPETFTTDDFTLRYEGKTQPADEHLSIENIDEGQNRRFRVDAPNLTVDGVYTLQVKTQNVEDCEGFLGQNGRFLRWMLFQDGFIHFFAGTWPELAGNIVDADGNPVITDVQNVDLGADLVLRAVPEEGYEFSYWGRVERKVTDLPTGLNSGSRDRAAHAPAQNGLTTITTEAQLTPVGTEPTITIPVNEPMEVRAVFTRKQYSVSVDYDKDHVLPAFSETRVNHGDNLSFKADGTQFDYEITGYRVTMGDAAPVTYPTTGLADGVLNLPITANTTIEVLFADHSPQKLLLSEDLDYEPADIENAFVGLYRSFRRGMWNTICLPVDISDPAAVFGTGTQVAAFTGTEGDALTFSLVDRMQAHVPYLIVPGRLLASTKVEVGASQMMSFSLGETSITAPSATPVAVGALTHSGTSVSSTGSTAFDFVGTYDITHLAPSEGNYYVSSNALYYVDQATASVGRFRAYFHTDAAALSAFRLAIGTDGSPTAITDATAEPLPPTAIYDAQGRRLGTSGCPLRSGVYIIGGHKCIVK